MRSSQSGQAEGVVPFVSLRPSVIGVGKKLGRQPWLLEFHCGGPRLHLHVRHGAVAGHQRESVVLARAVQAVVDRLAVAVLFAEKRMGRSLLAERNCSQA
jgi:hypothetical protein